MQEYPIQKLGLLRDKYSIQNKTVLFNVELTANKNNLQTASIMRKFQQGFTIIELIVVIAIIAVLSGVVMTNVTTYINKSKLARLNMEAENIGKAITMFYAKYGVYPYNSYYECSTDYCSAEIMAGSGNPGATVNGEEKYLSEFYKLDWTQESNIGYFSPNRFFYISMFDGSGDGKIDCGFIDVYDLTYRFCGTKIILKDGCNYEDTPFSITPYY